MSKSTFSQHVKELDTPKVAKFTKGAFGRKDPNAPIVAHVPKVVDVPKVADAPKKVEHPQPKVSTPEQDARKRDKKSKFKDIKFKLK